jgi:SAM-dependent methyltransferase
VTGVNPHDSGIEAAYGEYYAKRAAPDVYPVEFVVRTLLGTYPGLDVDRSTYAGAKILDLGFGDGRNMPLLANLGFEVSGVEISDEICEQTAARLGRLGIAGELRTGSNSAIPFATDTFDFVLACHSCYYVKDGERFEDNLREIGRVLRPGGRFVFSLAKRNTYILEGATALDDGHYRIALDPYGVRRDTIFRAFGSREEVRKELEPYFHEIALGLCENDWYGIEEKVWIGTCLRRSDPT